MTYEQELTHYGVKGMRWGKRSRRPQLEKSATRQKLDATKTKKKAAYKEYSKAYNNYAHNPLNSFTKKGAQKGNLMVEKAKKYNSANAEYKSAKRDRKDKIKKTHAKILSESSLKEQIMYNESTRKKAAKYVVDNNMPISEAKKKAKKEALRNTAVLLAVYGGAHVASVYQMNK